MLGKLIKYEWKNTYKVGCLLIGALFLVTLFGCISFQTPMWSAMASNGGGYSISIWDFMGIFSLVLYMLMLMGITYGILIYLGVHFYKSMYTDEGYLAHTLPVTPDQLLFSKIFISGVWTLFVTISVFVSVMALVFSMIAGLIEPTESVNAWELMGSAFSEMWNAMQNEGNFNVIHLTITILAMMLLTPFTSMITLFGAITIGQLFGKHRGIMSIVCYIIVMLVNMVLGAVFQLPVYIHYMVGTMNGTADMGSYMTGIYDSSVILSIVMAVVLYIVSHFILTKKLNMD